MEDVGVIGRGRGGLAEKETDSATALLAGDWRGW